MPVTPRQIEIFKAIMECGSISAAAQALRISQPAVSKALVVLETDIGMRLFERTHSGLVPSTEAHTLYTEVERTFVGLSYLRQFTQDLKGLKHGRLVVSVIPALSGHWLTRVIKSMMADYPQASFLFQAASSPQIMQMVAERRVDIGIAQSMVLDGTVERMSLFNLDGVCVIPKSNPLSELPEISPADLQGQAFVHLSPNDPMRAQVDRTFSEHDITLGTQLEVSLGLTAVELAGSGFGITIVDAGSAHAFRNDQVVIRPWRPKAKMKVVLLRPMGRPKSLIEEIFTKRCMSVSPAPAVSS